MNEIQLVASKSKAYIFKSKQMLKKIQKILLYRRLEFRYSLADVLMNMISSGQNTDDKMIKLL